MNPHTPYILCATNFSPQANDAANVAAFLARKRSEPLVIVHATGPADQARLTELNTRLEAEALRLGQDGAEVTSLLLEGPFAAEVILDHIHSRRPSLVVVAGTVKSPLDRWSLGSFSEEIAERSPAPTLVVKDPLGLRTWDWAGDRLKILLALDFHASSDVVLRWTKAFQTAGPCDLVACHVNRRWPTNEESQSGSGPVQNPAEVQERLERDLRKKVRDQTGSDVGSVVVKPYFGTPGSRLEEIARQLECDMIVVGTHQRRGLRRLADFSVSRELLHASGTNVVCVPLTSTFDPREAHVPDFRRVLVPTDFSDAGNSAVPYAFAACAPGCLVKLIHVVSTAPISDTDRDSLLSDLRALVPHEVAATHPRPGVEIVPHANVADAICGEADRFGADMVCMGSHGAGLSSALHGSVTNSVLKRLRRPLLIVRRPTG